MKTICSTSPNIDIFSKESVVFDRAYSPATATAASVRGLFSGKYVSRSLIDPKIPQFFTQDMIVHGYHHFMLTVFETNLNGIYLGSFLKYLSPEQKQLVTIRDYERFSHHFPTYFIEGLLNKIKNTAKMASKEVPGKRGWFTYIHTTSTHSPWFKRTDVEDFGA